MAVTWKQVLARIGPRPHIEAAGAFALAYNDLEFSLYSLMGLLLQEDDDLVPFLFAELNNSQKVDFIRRLCARQHSKAVYDSLDHALRCFSICAENRNLIMHASPAPPGTPVRDALHVVKGVKGRPDDMNEYTLSLTDLRNAAKSAHALSQHVYELVGAIADLSVGVEPDTWPQTPPTPRKLSLSLRPEVLSDARSQPPPSEA